MQKLYLVQHIMNYSVIMHDTRLYWNGDYGIDMCGLHCIVLYCICSLCCFYSVCNVFHWQVSCPPVARQNYGPTKWYKYVCMYVCNLCRMNICLVSEITLSLWYILYQLTVKRANYGEECTMFLSFLYQQNWQVQCM